MVKLEIVLEIVFTPETGNLALSGPIDNKIMCLGLLEEAKATLQAYHQKKLMEKLERKLVEVPAGLVIPPHIGKRD